MVISKAAQSLYIAEESIHTLVKLHRINSYIVDNEIVVDDKDIQYFRNYVCIHGKLPDISLDHSLNYLTKA